MARKLKSHQQSFFFRFRILATYAAALILVDVLFGREEKVIG